MKMKACFLFMFASLFISCVHEKSTIHLLNDKSINTFFIGDIKEDSPTLFEKTFPKSSLLKKSVVVFKKTYPEKLLAVGVIDFDRGIILTDKFLINLDNINSCGIFSLPNDQIDQIYSGNRIIMLKGKKNFYFLDLYKCGQILEMRAQQVVGFDGNNIFFQKGSTLLEKNIFTKIVVKLFDFNEAVSRVELIDNYFFILTKNDNLIVKKKIEKDYVDVANFVGVKDFGFQKRKNVTQLYFKKNNKFFTFNIDSNGLTKKAEKVVDEIFYLVEGKVGYFSTEFLYVNSEKLLLNNNYERLIFYGNKLYGIVNGAIYQIDISKKIYRKSLILKPIKIKGCIENNRIYVKDLDDKIRELDLVTESFRVVKKIPADCRSLPYLHGKFILDAKEIVYAKVVNNDKNYLMFKRKINNNIYYFFEKY
ncbi:hypothetical protein [Deferribacter abyssi]|uniref:hypothetical protein n=1 Tax=Deferribacter abyssi TaxID=213806 RepID=UPI003C22EB4A